VQTPSFLYLFGRVGSLFSNVILLSPPFIFPGWSWKWFPFFCPLSGAASPALVHPFGTSAGNPAGSCRLAIVFSIPAPAAHFLVHSFLTVSFFVRESSLSGLLPAYVSFLPPRHPQFPPWKCDSQFSPLPCSPSPGEPHSF